MLRGGKNVVFNNVITEENSTLRINATGVGLARNAKSNTTIIESTGAVEIPVASYGNLIIKGTGAKSLIKETTVTVRNKLTIEPNTPVNNATQNNAEFLALGDVEILGSGNFVPTRPFSIRFGWLGTQTLKLTPPRTAFQHIRIGKGNTVNVSYTGTPGILELSSSTAGELTILEGGVLKLNEGILSLKNDEVYL